MERTDLPFKPSATAVALLGAAGLALAGALLYPGASQAADTASGANTANAASAAPKADQPGQPRPALTVSSTQPQRSALPLLLAANGNVAAWQEASIGAESAGLRLTEVRVNVGDAVKAGQLLARFSAETIEADVARARASLLEAQALAAEAAANAERARSLQPTGVLSRQQFQQIVTAEQTAQARVQAAQAGLDAQQLRLKYTQVLAPDSGVISARSATVGAVVAAGSELFRMLRRGRLEWRAEVTSTELRRIRPGARVSVTAASGATVEGSVRQIAPTVDPQTRNALVYVDLPAHPDIRAGMFARGEFALGSSAALTVPQEALVLRDGFAYVFTIDAARRVQQRKVQTGRRVGDRVEVLEGLDADARIAVRGAGFLNDGDLVRVADAGTAAAATGAAGAAQAPQASH